MREERRTKILEAARRVFARKGLGVTVDDVAAEASVSLGLAYRYFANKEAIFPHLSCKPCKPLLQDCNAFLRCQGRQGSALPFPDASIFLCMLKP